MDITWFQEKHYKMIIINNTKEPKEELVEDVINNHFINIHIILSITQYN